MSALIAVAVPVEEVREVTAVRATSAGVAATVPIMETRHMTPEGIIAALVNPIATTVIAAAAVAVLVAVVMMKKNHLHLHHHLPLLTFAVTALILVGL